MNAILMNGGSSETCEPVTSTRPLAACPIANRPLAKIQKERLAAAGYSLHDEETGNDLFIPENAWLSDALLRKLGQLRAPSAIRDGNGALLAWIGESAQAVLNANPVTPDSASFLIRYPWDLLAVQEQVMGDLTKSRIEGDLSPAATLAGTLILGKGSRILPGVYLEGAVVIGTNCKIGPNCYIRGSTSIGNDSHIGQAVEIKNSIIMDHVSMGHLSYCGDSVIGSRVNFGAGTITANFRHDGKTHRSMIRGQLLDTGRRKFGAVLGDHVHTGIHTSLYPGRKLWPHVSTLPGAVVKHDIPA